MTISIIIPVYNVEAYITECLESVVQQTYQGEMECLIVDDCGTDNSISVAEQFIQIYQGDIRFRILHHKHNRGLSAARNTGVEAATGDYVYFLDSDDAIVPETIELMVNVVCKHPKVEMVQGGIMSMKGEPTDDFTKRQLPEYTDDVDWIMDKILFHLPVCSWNRLLKREFLIREGISFHEGIIHEDVPYNFILALKCRYIGFVKQNTYLFRPQRIGSITTTRQEERALESRIIIMKECIEAYHTHNYDSKKQLRVVNMALWRKWLTYMVIHNHTTLSKYREEIECISNQMASLTPCPWNLLAFSFKIIPQKAMQNKYLLKAYQILLSK